MSQNLIEPLESRTLLSATIPPAALAVQSDSTALLAAAKVAVADAAHCAKIAAADVKAIAGDLRRLKGQPQDAALLKTFKSNGASSFKMLQHDASGIAHNGSPTIKRLVADAVKVIKNPSNTTYQSNLSGDVVSLGVLAVSAPITQLGTDATQVEQTLNNDLDALASANPTDAKVQTDVATAKSDLAACQTTLGGDANTIVADLKTAAMALVGV